jgi:hypothetical protein
VRGIALLVDCELLLDGNKRVRFLLAYVFLARNGYSLTASEAESTRAVLDLASGSLSVNGKLIADLDWFSSAAFGSTGSVVVAKDTGATMDVHSFKRDDHCHSTEPSATPQEWTCESIVANGFAYPVFHLADPADEEICSAYRVEQ